MFVPDTLRKLSAREDASLQAELEALREFKPPPRRQTMRRRSAPTLPPLSQPPRRRASATPALPPAVVAEVQEAPPRRPAPAEAPPPPPLPEVDPAFFWDRALLGDVEDVSISSDDALAAKTRGVLWRVVRSVGAVDARLSGHTRADGGARAHSSVYWEYVIESAYPKELVEGHRKEPTLFIGVCLPSEPNVLNPVRSHDGWYFSVETGSVYHRGFQRRLTRSLRVLPKLGATFGLRLSQPRGTLEVFMDGRPIGVAFERVPPGVHAAAGLYLLGEAVRLVPPQRTAHDPPPDLADDTFAAPSRGLHRAATFAL